MKKRCARCKKIKNLFDFFQRKKFGRLKYNRLCKSCSLCERKWAKNSRKKIGRKIVLQRQAQSYSKCKFEVIKKYGGKCECCGENEPKFLCIDHVNGGGDQEKRKLGITSSGLYWRLKNKKINKKKYQLLCHNCNSAKGYYGQCLHKLKN